MNTALAGQLTCRRYQDSDLADIMEMAEQVVRDGTVFPFENVRGVCDYWFGDHCQVFVCEAENEVVGTYVIKPNHPDRCAHVANAGYMVNQRWRGSGVGLTMGQHSLVTAKQLGYMAMQFNVVVSTNAAAIQLWERLGFVTIGTVPNAFRIDLNQYVDLLIMYRRLSDIEIDHH